MPNIPNITADSSGAWDTFAKVEVAQSFALIYQHAQAHSLEARTWYWKSIARKKRFSIGCRLLSFLLLTCGALLPLMAAVVSEDHPRLLCTQIAVGALALAGLLQAMDKIFGWSTGWLRYITTVTAMENATRRFELGWASYTVSKVGALGADDRRPLFDLVQQLETDINKLQADETEKWVVEFNDSAAALGDLVKSQRESSNKAIEAAQAALDAHLAATAEKAKSEDRGAIELTIKYQTGPSPVLISIDDRTEPPFTGVSWARLGIAPGQHTVCVVRDGDGHPAIVRIAAVPPGGVARLEVELP